MAERTRLVFNSGNAKTFKTHEYFFDPSYAKELCFRAENEKRPFKTEHSKNAKYKVIAKKIYNFALEHGEKAARPYYLEHKEAYEKYYDLDNISFLAFLRGGDCEGLEKEGYFGKQ